jgi:hypothetical protein
MSAARADVAGDDAMARIALGSMTPMESSEHITTEQVSDTSITEAVLDVVEAGQRVVVDRIELIRSDALRSINELQHKLLVWAAAAALFSIAWVAINCTVTLLLAQRFTWVIATFIAAGINAVIGLALIMWSTRHRVVVLRGTLEEAK